MAQPDDRLSQKKTTGDRCDSKSGFSTASLHKFRLKDRFWPEVARPRPPPILCLSLFSHLQSIIYLYPKVSDSTFQLRMTQEQLNGSQVFPPTVYQRCLGMAQRMRAID